MLFCWLLDVGKAHLMRLPPPHSTGLKVHFLGSVGAAQEGLHDLVLLQAEEREQRRLEQRRARAQAEVQMASERQKLEEAALPLMLDAMWAANVMDIQQTLRIVCQDVRAFCVARICSPALYLES